MALRPSPQIFKFYISIQLACVADVIFLYKIYKIDTARTSRIHIFFSFYYVYNKIDYIVPCMADL